MSPMMRLSCARAVLAAWRGAVLPAGAALIACSTPSPAGAAMWKEVGHPVDAPSDKVFLDLDSIARNGDFRQAVLMTVYPTPRLNAGQMMLDRLNRTEAFDCAGQRISGMVSTGFLQGQPVGRSLVNPDWKNQFTPLPDDAFSRAVFDQVCSATRVPPAASMSREFSDGQPVTVTNHGPGALGSSVNGDVNGPTDARGNRRSSSGSGVVVTADGAILTNRHVVSGCDQLLVRAGDGAAGSASLEAVDGQNDLALLRSSLHFPEGARFRTASRPGRLGEFVGVVGYPLTGFLSTDPKATFGEVTSVSGPGNDHSLLQISAPVQPGNSGSPVFDASGTVIGVVVAEAALSIAGASGNIPQNVNFAIRGEVAQTFLRAHGIGYDTADLHDKLATEDVADRGQKVAVLIVCRRSP